MTPRKCITTPSCPRTRKRNNSICTAAKRCGKYMQGLRPSGPILHIIYGGEAVLPGSAGTPEGMSATDKLRCGAVCAVKCEAEYAAFPAFYRGCPKDTHMRGKTVGQMWIELKNSWMFLPRRKVCGAGRQKATVACKTGRHLNYLCDERGATGRCVGGGAVWLTTGRLA